MEKFRLIKNVSLYAALAVGGVFLFIGGPALESSRSSYHIWDMGHIILFAILTYLLIKDLPFLDRQNFWTQAIIILVITAVLGIITELIQVKLDRSPDIDDIGRNFIGSAIALVFFARSRRKLPGFVLVLLQATVVLAFIRESYPLGRSLLDEAIAKSQFPVLADFETPFEVDRWQEKWRINIDDKVSRNGQHGLRVNLTPAKYSGVSFKYFPSDWHDYNYLKISIFNPDPDTLKIFCRIHDKNHNNMYSDRFNRAFKIIPGWNDLSIPLEQIRKSPREREMDMYHLDLIGLFTVDLQQSRVLYFDYIYLTV